MHHRHRELSLLAIGGACTQYDVTKDFLTTGFALSYNLDSLTARNPSDTA